MTDEQKNLIVLDIPKDDEIMSIKESHNTDKMQSFTNYFPHNNFEIIFKHDLNP